MLTFVVLVITLSLIVLVHEFGHFITAKKLGVRVEEFGVGIPPRLFGKRIKGTIYSINLLPFGGFVKLKGEDDFDLQDIESPDPESFAFKSPIKRGIILFSGVFMNMVLGVFLYYIILTLNGYKSLNIPLFYDFSFKYGTQEVLNTTVMSFSKDSAAQLAGIQAGEAVLELDGVPVYSAKDVRDYVATREGVPVKVLLTDLRQASRPLRTVEVSPKKSEDVDGVVLGVYLSPSVSIHYFGRWEKLLVGPLHSYNMLSYTVFTLKNLVSDSFQEKDISLVAESVSGPVGIYSVIEAIFKYGGSKAYLSLLDLIALMSVSLAVINLLPVPALDGGRLLFVVLEGIRGKRVFPKLEETLHRWGMLVLLLVLVLVTAKDLFRIFD